MTIADGGGVTFSQAIDVTGSVTVGSDGSGQDVTFYSATSGDTFLWDSSRECLILTGTNTNNALEVADGDVEITDNLIVAAGKIFMNEATDANTTIGMTINQGAADDKVLTFKSSDVAHPFTALAETDTYGQFGKGGFTTGGLRIRGYSESTYFALSLLGYQEGTPVTVNSIYGWPIIAADAYHTDASTGSQAAPADSNLFGVVSAGAQVKFIVDSEGDIHYDGSASAYDDEDDIGLLRAVQKAVAPDKVITQEFDKFLNANEDDLIRLGILGMSRTPDEETGEYGLVCLTKLTQLLTGAAVQLYGG